MTIINALNDVWSDTHIMEIIIQEELDRLMKILHENLILKTYIFQSKLEILTKLRKNCIKISVFGYDHTLQRWRKKLCGCCSQAFITKEILKYHIHNCFKITGNKGVRYLKNGEYINSKIMRGKLNHHLWSMQILKIFHFQKIIERKIWMSLIRANIKNMLLTVTVINWVDLLDHIYWRYWYYFKGKFEKLITFLSWPFWDWIGLEIVYCILKKLKFTFSWSSVSYNLGGSKNL